MSLEAENARLRAELETVTRHRNSAHRKAKCYFRKWKRLSQEAARLDPATAMQEWLESQADSYRRSMGDVGWFTDSDDWLPRMRAKQEAFQDALDELKRLRKV